MSSTENPKFKHKLAYLIMAPLLRLMAWLPWPLVHGAAAWLGRLLFHLATSLRQVCLANLAIAYPQLTRRKRRQLARRSLEEVVKSIFELGKLWHAPVPSLLARISVRSGEAAIQQAREQGRGIIVLAPHLGSFEVLGLYLGKHYGITNMYRPPPVSTLEPLIIRGRTRVGQGLVPTDLQGVRALLKTLKQGGMIGLLPDQDPGAGNGVFTPFFGRPANTVTLLSRLASKSGALVVYAWAERLPRGRGFVLDFEVAEDAVGSNEVTTAVTAMNQGVEHLIQRCPAQYLWAYRRYRTTPAGLTRLYR